MGSARIPSLGADFIFPRKIKGGGVRAEKSGSVPAEAESCPS